MIKFIKKLFKKDPKFFDKEGKEVEYIKYLEDEEFLIVDRGNGLEKIPAEYFKRVD